MVGAALGLPEFPKNLPIPSGPIIVAWLEPSEQAWLLVIPTADPQDFLRALRAEPLKRPKKGVRGAKLLRAPAMPEARWWAQPGHVLGAASAARATRAQSHLKQGSLPATPNLGAMHKALAFGSEISGFVNVQKKGGAYPVDKLAFGVALQDEHILIRAVVGTTTSAIARPQRTLAELPLVETATLSLFVSVATLGARAADLAKVRLGWRSYRFDEGLVAPPWSDHGKAALDGHFVEAETANGATEIALGLRAGASASTATAATEAAGARGRAWIDRNAIVLPTQRTAKGPPFWSAWSAPQRRLLPTQPVSVLVVSSLRPPTKLGLLGLQDALGSHIGFGSFFGSSPATKKLEARLQERASEARNLASSLNRARRLGRQAATNALGPMVVSGGPESGWLLLEGGFALPTAPRIALANARRALLSGRPTGEALLAVQVADRRVARVEKQLERARSRAMTKMFEGSLSGEMLGNGLGGLGASIGGGVGSGGLGLGGMGFGRSGGMGSGRGGGGTAAGFGGIGTLGKRVRSPRLTLQAGGPAELRAFVKRKLRRLEYCYQSSKVDTDELKGELTIQLAVDNDRRVVPGATTGPAATHISVCLKRALRGRLPDREAQSGTVRLRYARP